MIRWFAALSIVSFSIPAFAQETDALLSPLPVRDQYLLNNGFFFFEPEGARVLDDDAWLVDVHTADSNTFAKSRWISHDLDGDTDRRSGDQTLAIIRIDPGTTIFLADINDFTAVNAIYGEKFPHDPPARATVQAARLPRDARVEIDAIAVIP